MKTFTKLCLFASLILAISCSKDKSDKNCSPSINYPSVKFRVVSATDGTDLFFSTAPKYLLTDIKIRYKNSTNKVDSVAPATATLGSTKYFLYKLPALRLNDTAYVKVSNLKSDTLYTTLKMTTNACGAAYSIINVKINQQPATTYSDDTIIIIKK
jgi:hypothetical protein